MAAQHTSLHIYEGDEIHVRARTTSVGCIISFGAEVQVFLTPEKEAELLAALQARAPCLPRLVGDRPAQPGEFAPAVADWLEREKDRFIREITGGPPEADTDADPSIVPFPSAGTNFRRVGSFGGCDGDAQHEPSDTLNQQDGAA